MVRVIFNAAGVAVEIILILRNRPPCNTPKRSFRNCGLLDSSMRILSPELFRFANATSTSGRGFWITQENAPAKSVLQRAGCRA